VVRACCYKFVFQIIPTHFLIQASNIEHQAGGSRMTLKKLVSNLPSENQMTLNLEHISDIEKFKDAVIAVMNTSGVSTGLGTHYNTK